MSRRHRIPGRKLKPHRFQTRSTNKWTNDQSKIAFFSVVVATIGAVISALSTLLMYQQLRILNNERLTPYRAIFYSSRQDSMEKMLLAQNQYYTTLQWVLMENEARVIFGSKEIILTKDHKSAILRDFNLLITNISSTQHLWPDNLTPDFNDVTYDAHSLYRCVIKSSAMTSNQQIIKREGCSFDAFVEHYKGFEQGVTNLNSKLNSLLENDRFGQIPAISKPEI